MKLDVQVNCIFRTDGHDLSISVKTEIHYVIVREMCMAYRLNVDLAPTICNLQLV